MSSERPVTLLLSGSLMCEYEKHVLVSYNIKVHIKLFQFKYIPDHKGLASGLIL